MAQHGIEPPSEPIIAGPGERERVAERERRVWVLAFERAEDAAAFRARWL